MIIDSLIYKTGVDLSGLGKDLRRVDTTVGRSLDSIGVDLKRLKMPSFDVAMPKGIADMKPPALDSGDMMAGVAMIRGGIAGMGSDLKRSMAPLNAFAADFASKFDRIGPVIEKLAIRIDAAMRFPQFERRIEGARAAILRPFGMLPGMVGKQFASVGDRVGSALDFAVGKAKSGMDRLKATVASYDLGDSTHVSPVMSYRATRTRKNNRFTGTAPGGTVQAPPSTMAGTSAPAAGIKGMIGKAASDPGWGLLAAAGKKAGAGLAEAFRGVAGPLAFVSRGTAIFASNLLGSWRSVARGQSVLSSFGSVAKATWGTLAKIKTPKLSFDPKQSIVLKGIGAAARGVGGAFTAMLGPLAPILSIFGAVTAVGGFFKAGIVGATGLNETLSKTDAVLGPASAGVKSFADDMAGKFGLVKQQTLDVASGFGGIAKGMGGLSGKGLEDSTKQFTKLAADLSSFKNISFEDAAQAIRTNLSGEASDTLKQLGVVTDEAAVKSYALAHGFGKDLTAAEEFGIRGKLLMAGLADAQGDLDWTGGSTANQFRKMQGQLTNFATAIGTAVMPAVDKLLGVGMVIVGTFSTAFDSVRPYVDTFVDYLGKGYDLVAAGISHPTAAFQVLKLKAIEVASNVIQWFGVIPENLAQYASYIGRNWYQMLGDFANNSLKTVENVIGNFGKLGDAIGTFLADPMKGFPAVSFTPLTEGFISTAEKLPALIRPVLTDLSREIATAGKPIWDDFNKRQLKVEPPAFKAAKGDALAGLDKGEKAPKEKKGEKKPKEFGEAAEFASSEYVAAVNRALYGTPKRQDAKLENLSQRQLDVQIRQLEEAKRANRAKAPEVVEVRL